MHILTGGDRSQERVIGEEGSGIYFPAEDPVVVESCVNDTFDHLLRHQATVTLQTREFLPDLFSRDCRDTIVNIFKGDECVFAGFVEPQTYSQGFNEVYDDLELSCIDMLTALQYSKYKDIGSAGVDFTKIKNAAGLRTFHEITGSILGGISADICIAGDHSTDCLYDGSRALTANPEDRYAIFNQLSVSDLLFMNEDEEDDVWAKDTILEAVLKYLNLHIVQLGFDFYIFSWDSLRNATRIEWRSIGGENNRTTEIDTIEISTDIAEGTSTSISVGEVFNQIKLTCKVEAIEELISNPLDDDTLEDPYTNAQKYLTEYVMKGSVDTNKFAPWVMGSPTDTDHSVTDWYVRVKNSPNWVFREPDTGDSMVDKYCQDNKNQQNLPNQLAIQPAAGLVSLGKITLNEKDNSVVSSIDMANYLVIGVNGYPAYTQPIYYPTDESLRAAAPVAIYTGKSMGTAYSPSDENITNYIVFSGKIVLNTQRMLSAHYKGLVEGTEKPVRYVDKDDKEYMITQRYYKAETPQSIIQENIDAPEGLNPYADRNLQRMEYKYGAVGTSDDTVSKVGIIACMLIIGDKCLVETFGGRGSGMSWQPYKTEEECATIDEYYAQSFTLGFDPAIGDYLIGTEFDLQNTVHFSMGIDASGTAIPVKKSDSLHGDVEFKILGPVNYMWGDVTHRHSTWFRSEKWDTNDVPLLSHVSNIMIKDFSVKIYTDSGGLDNLSDDDLVYVSDSGDSFINRKDDIDFEISSALTAEECQELGVINQIALSTAVDTATGLGVLTVYDYFSELSAKPEKLYVDTYYNEYSRPLVLMSQELTDQSEVAGYFHRYRHPAMPGKEFHTQGISRNLIEGTTELTLKEIWHG